MDMARLLYDKRYADPHSDHDKTLWEIIHMNTLVVHIVDMAILLTHKRYAGPHSDHMAIRL